MGICFRFVYNIVQVYHFVNNINSLFCILLNGSSSFYIVAWMIVHMMHGSVLNRFFRFVYNIVQVYRFVN